MNFVSVYDRWYAFTYKNTNFPNANSNCWQDIREKNLTEACNFDQIYMWYFSFRKCILNWRKDKEMYLVLCVKSKRCRICSSAQKKNRVVYLKTCMSNKLDRIRSYWNAIIQMYIDFVQHSHKFFTSILFYLCPTFSLFSLEYIGKGFKSMSHV